MDPTWAANPPVTAPLRQEYRATHRGLTLMVTAVSPGYSYAHVTGSFIGVRVLAMVAEPSDQTIEGWQQATINTADDLADNGWVARQSA